MTGVRVLLSLLLRTASAAAVIAALAYLYVASAHATGRLLGVLSPCFPPAVMRWEDDILRWAREYGLDPNLVAVVMTLESSGEAQAVSLTGARGLFQVMPGHFTAGEDPLDPETNARRGLDYLRRAWQAAHGNVYRTLAAYNGGLGVLALPESRWPAETRQYARNGLAMWKRARSNQCQNR